MFNVNKLGAITAQNNTVIETNGASLKSINAPVNRSIPSLICSIVKLNNGRLYAGIIINNEHRQRARSLEWVQLAPLYNI